MTLSEQPGKSTDMMFHNSPPGKTERTIGFLIHTIQQVRTRLQLGQHDHHQYWGCQADFCRTVFMLPVPASSDRRFSRIRRRMAVTQQTGR